jgi:hypothetical protein
MAELANRIARNERGGTGVGEIEQNGSRRRRRVHDGRGSSVFSSANVVLVLQSASGAMQLQGFRAEKGDSVSKHRLIQWFLNPSAHPGSAQSAFHRNFAPVFVSVRLKVVVVSGTTPPPRDVRRLASKLFDSLFLPSALSTRALAGDRRLHAWSLECMNY